MPGTPVVVLRKFRQLHVPRPNNSELWQRLRAARELAHKSHQDVADAVGLSEVTVTSWESPDHAARTQPTAQQVMRIAKLCRLPLYLLVDDAVSVQDIEAFERLCPPRLRKVALSATQATRRPRWSMTCPACHVVDLVPSLTATHISGRWRMRPSATAWQRGIEALKARYKPPAREATHLHHRLNTISEKFFERRRCNEEASAMLDRTRAKVLHKARITAISALGIQKALDEVELRTLERHMGFPGQWESIVAFRWTLQSEWA